MASYSWAITEDHITSGGKPGTNLNSLGVTWPRGSILTIQEIISKGRPFKMYDGDGELYYCGYLVGGNGHEPLDDFGTPNAGAIRIELFENGEWVVL